MPIWGYQIPHQYRQATDPWSLQRFEGTSREPQQPNTRATQRILDKIKVMQKKIKDDVTQLAEIKSKWEELLKKEVKYQKA